MQQQPALPTGVDEALRAWTDEGRELSTEEAQLLRKLDEEVYRLYGIQSEDAALIERELARRPKAEGGYSAAELTAANRGAGERETTNGQEAEEAGEAGEDEEPEEASEDADEGNDAAPDVEDLAAEVTPDRVRHLVARWLSFYLKQVLEADEDGIAPLEAQHGEPALVLRLREAMARDLGAEAADALAVQAPKYLGAGSLGEWLAGTREEMLEVNGRKQRAPVGFFPWHVAVYRNRPVFWLLSSEGFESGKTRFTFRAYVHYLRLTPDTLPRLVAYYVDPAIDGAEREWNLARDQANRLEGKPASAARRAADECLNTADALKGFKAALDRVIQGPERAEAVSPRAKWLPRTIAEVRGGQDLGRGYQPEIDHGVRVNITPLVEQRVLPRAVLKRLGG